MIYLEHTEKQQPRSSFSLNIIEQYTGYISFQTNDSRFLKECGGHRFQRVPPTESNGRVHTSTVTVACLAAAQFSPTKNMLCMNDIQIEYYRSSGPGGQNKNKVETACRLKYKDIIVTCADERSKRQNYERALKELKRRVSESQQRKLHQQENSQRQNQIGSGQRGDKIRTYREKDDIVIDHRTDKKYRMSNIMNGDILII